MDIPQEKSLRVPRGTIKIDLEVQSIYIRKERKREKKNVMV